MDIIKCTVELASGKPSCPAEKILTKSDVSPMVHIKLNQVYL